MGIEVKVVGFDVAKCVPGARCRSSGEIVLFAIDWGDWWLVRTGFRRGKTIAPLADSSGRGRLVARNRTSRTLPPP